MKKVNLIGYGNVGYHLSNQLSRAKIDVHIVTHHSQETHQSNNIHFYNQFKDLPKDVDFCIICVRDDQISIVAKELNKEIPTVHTSGTKSLDILREFEQYGVLYPLQTFSKDRSIQLEDVPFLIEGNNDDFQKKLIDFCDSYLSHKTEIADSDKRKKIHLAAVFACNFTTALWQISHEHLQQINLDLSILRPLILETVKKTVDIGPEQAMTGPAKRGDEETIEEHLKMLSESDKEIYRLLTNKIKSIFSEK